MEVIHIEYNVQTSQFVRCNVEHDLMVLLKIGNELIELQTTQEVEVMLIEYNIQTSKFILPHRTRPYGGKIGNELNSRQLKQYKLHLLTTM